MRIPSRFQCWRPCCADRKTGNSTKWKGISMRMHQLAWRFAKTCDSSCLCHGEGSSPHSIGEVSTNQAGVHKTILWNQSAHGEASLKWCKILAFLWIGVLFCMGALGGCVALSTLWRLFNFKIFLAKKNPTFPMGLTNDISSSFLRRGDSFLL